MAQSIDVDSKSQDYITLFQSKSSSSEFKIADKNPKNNDEKIFVAKNQTEKNSDSNTAEISVRESDPDNLNKTKKDNAEDKSKIIYGANKDASEITIGPKGEQNQALIAYGSGNSDDISIELLGDAKYSIMNSYGALAAAVGANTRGVTKMDLMAYLQRVSSDSDTTSNNAEVIAFLKNLIAQFDTLSGGGDYLTSLTGIKEPQDYSTVTQEQVTPPIDLRV